MGIFIAIIMFLLGTSASTAIFCYYGRKTALEDQEYWRDRAINAEKSLNEASRNLSEANKTAQYYDETARYWHGVAIGDKAQTLYDSALQSLENGEKIAWSVTRKRSQSK